MNNKFDIHRLGMVISWDLHTYWKKYLGITAGLTIALSLIYLMHLNSLSFFIETHGGDYDHFFLERMAGCPMGLIFVTFYALSTCIFINMKEKFERENFMMLPANNIEKFIARLLIMGVGSIIMASIACIFGDLIQLMFSFYFTPGHHNSVTIEICKSLATMENGDKPLQALFFSSNKLELTLAAWSLAILFHSFGTLGGTIYRKHPILLTAFTGLVLSLIFSFGGMQLAEWGFFDLFPTIDYSNETFSLCVSLFWSAVCLGLAATCYWASYKLFTRMQLICNKWVNI